MAASDPPEIVIAGGGIGGLSAALALALQGRRVRVLEKAGEFGEIGYGIQMGPNVYPMLERLGVVDAMMPQAVFPDALVLMDAISGKEISRISTGAAFRARYKYPYFVIHRRDLHGAILEACRQHPGIALETSKGVANFEDRGERVAVLCEDGSQYEAAALIGAEGLWSPLRAAIVGDGPPRLIGHVVYRGVVPTDQIIDQSHLDSMVIYIGRNMHLVQYRLRGGTVMNNVATIASERFKRGEKEFGGPEELDGIFSQTTPSVREMLRYVSRDRNWVLHDREPVSNWTRGKVTLLGDAAHPTVQYLAQGACMAIEDALVLAAKVGPEMKDSATDFNRAFLAYQQERFFRTARVQLTARFFGELIHVGGGARELRNHLASKRDPDNCWEVDWLYRGIEIRP
jgi:2-polyprenyl-6-methoxyphenol hydroxylase-like FAD-dependent oxidoreductase